MVDLVRLERDGAFDLKCALVAFNLFNDFVVILKIILIQTLRIQSLQFSFLIFVQFLFSSFDRFRYLKFLFIFYH
jgi:hypothetical protein